MFNPVITARDATGRRLLATLRDFKRLNHRMHNKLFIADAAVAVLGGRNLADEYFLRGVQGNFIDFDLLCVGAVVGPLGSWFDLYWSSTVVYPVQAIAQVASAEPPPPADTLRARFEAATRGDAVAPLAVAEVDLFGAPGFSCALAQRRFRLLPGEAVAFADSPDKITPESHRLASSDTLAHRFLNVLAEAHDEVLLFSAQAARLVHRPPAREVGFRRPQDGARRLDEPRPALSKPEHRNRRARGQRASCDPVAQCENGAALE